MKALVLNGERNNESALSLVAEIVTKELSFNGWQAETVLLREKRSPAARGASAAG